MAELANTILDYHVSVGATNGESAENWRTRILRLCIVRRRSLRQVWATKTSAVRDAMTFMEKFDITGFH